MKKFALISILFVIFLSLCGCKDTTPRIFLSTKPIMKETFKPMDEFKVNDSINFVLIVPKGFKGTKVRIQLVKKSNISAIYGYKLVLGKDYNIENHNYLTGAFTVYEPGRYEVYFYDFGGLQRKKHFPAKQYNPKPAPVAHVQFGVYD